VQLQDRVWGTGDKAARKCTQDILGHLVLWLAGQGEFPEGRGSCKRPWFHMESKGDKARSKGFGLSPGPSEGSPYMSPPWGI
jgi:hypothetical protein